MFESNDYNNNYLSNNACNDKNSFFAHNDCSGLDGSGWLISISNTPIYLLNGCFGWSGCGGFDYYHVCNAPSSSFGNKNCDVFSRMK